MTYQEGASGPELIGPLLRRLRQARGLSQLRVADQLCQVAGAATVTRHDVSRWERGQRVPTLWLYPLAVVLEAPLEHLEGAVTATRERIPGPRARPPGQPWLWRPLVGVDLQAALDRSRVDDLRRLAHAWLAGPPDGWDDRTVAAASVADQAAVDPDGTGRDLLGRWEARLGRLRRADDLLGGQELAGRVDRRLREVVALLRKVGHGGSRLRTRALRLVAGYAHLAGWVNADAGNGLAARRAYRVGLKAATVAGDQPLAAYLLGSLASLSLHSGTAGDALLLARTGLAGLTRPGDPGQPPGAGSYRLRALLLHRAALAAAQLGQRHEAGAMLAQAERVVDRSRPEDEPAWLYWLDQDELTAMTGWCLAELGRHLRAARLLAAGQPRGGPRSAALYGCWLARCYAALGEVEAAQQVVDRLHPQVVAAGSARAEAALRHAQAEVMRHRRGPGPAGS